ncbi:MAG: hypothetical protein A2798_01745 [Candidatus Levybacteria bacterium RIFCSPHIGHO2_01_FULL_37_17]|nr:MAG: hypothetical protein A2798_01745 [Candidatus Levybacteria bacterium RIFCSPHIGHO2_01_FULL_37_17]OGH37171.1 MAG: hypothetical protein A2959_02605 [Candidatus Levybacteria bacterium RIFCSPLOWO2_01_FULL_38_23]
MNIKPNPNIPTDQKLLDLLKDAYTKNFECYKALIKFDAIKPFSNYVPEIIRGDLDRFAKEEEKQQFHYLFVYQEGDKFIMSDDYKAYYCYKIIGTNEVPCVVLGEPKGENVTFKGKPFLLEAPQIKITKNE